MPASDSQRDQRREPLADGLSKTVKREAGRTSASNTPVRFLGLGRTVDPERHLSTYCRSRLGFKLGKFASRITRVSVRFVDHSGPIGKPTIACRITSSLVTGHEVVVEKQRESHRVAFDASADAHERAVRRQLERRVRKPSQQRSRLPRPGAS